ncbi:MAG: aquaporin [Deltaproteobacteria bacterium]|nr:aquaporin [Deltaproteobacteria bacterium]
MTAWLVVLRPRHWERHCCALKGLAVPHLITCAPLVSASGRARVGSAQDFGGIRGDLRVGRSGPCVLAHAHGSAAGCSGAYVASVHRFTASASFANPAVTLAHAVMKTISPVNAPGFINAQLMGGAVSAVLFIWLLRAWSDGTGLRQDRKASL